MHQAKHVFDLKPDEDVFWCSADVGWVTGHSYIVYGPLMCGVTSVMYEGAPDYPDRDIWWELCERYGVTVCYTAPTAIRACIKWGVEHPQKHDLSSLRLLGTVGEPINPKAWVWYWKAIGGGRCPIVDTWWQTETGHIMISPLPGATPLKPGSATRPLPGIDAAARKDDDGYFWIIGRVDDVINVSGHRLSTAEVESAIVSHAKVAESSRSPSGSGRWPARSGSSGPTTCRRPARGRSCGGCCGTSPRAASWAT